MILTVASPLIGSETLIVLHGPWCFMLRSQLLAHA
jgi:hypothetical protein